MCAGRQRLGDVSRIAYAAIGDERDIGILERCGNLADGRNLRHADARDDPGRADRSRTDTDLYPVGAGLDERLGSLGSNDVAADDLHVSVFRLDGLHALEDPFGETVCRIDHDDIHARRDERLDALIGIKARADRGAHAQRTALVLAGLREVLGLLEILGRDHALELIVLVDHEHFLDPVPMQQRLDLVVACALTHRD